MIPEDFETLYVKWTPFVRYILNDRGCTEAIDDLTQDVFSNVFRFGGSYNGLGFKAWLARITQNVAARHKKERRNEEVKLRRFRKQRMLEDIDGSGSPEYLYHVLRLTERAHALVDRNLSGRGKRVYEMLHFEGRSYKDVAEEFGDTIPTIKSLAYRAKRRLIHNYEALKFRRDCEGLEF